MPNLLFENRLQRIQSLVDPLNGLFKRFIARVLRFVHLFGLPHTPKERSLARSTWGTVPAGRGLGESPGTAPILSHFAYCCRGPCFQSAAGERILSANPNAGPYPGHGRPRCPAAKCDGNLLFARDCGCPTVEHCTGPTACRRCGWPQLRPGGAMSPTRERAGKGGCSAHWRSIRGAGAITVKVARFCNDWGSTALTGRAAHIVVLANGPK